MKAGVRSQGKGVKVIEGASHWEPVDVEEDQEEGTQWKKDVQGGRERCSHQRTGVCRSSSNHPRIGEGSKNGGRKRKAAIREAL